MSILDKKGRLRPLIDDIDVDINPGDVQIGAVEIKNGTDDTRAVVDATGLNVAVINSLVPSKHDYISRNWNAGTFTETWTYKTGGSGGTTVATIIIVYDDVNMSNIVTLTKT